VETNIAEITYAIVNCLIKRRFDCLIRQWAKGAICRYALSWFLDIL